MVFGMTRISSRSWRSTGNREPLYDEPEYQAMIAEIEADMAEQLARVREMERNGKLITIAEATARSQ